MVQKSSFAFNFWSCWQSQLLRGSTASKPGSPNCCFVADLRVNLACARLSDSMRSGNVLKAKLRRAREQGMAHWWERSSPTNMVRVQIPGLTPYMYVGWVCCRFSPLLREVFLYSGFPLSSKTNISKFQFDQELGRQRTNLWMWYLQIIIIIIITIIIIGTVALRCVRCWGFLDVDSRALPQATRRWINRLMARYITHYAALKFKRWFECARSTTSKCPAKG